MSESSWVKIGKEYIVISVTAVPERAPKLQIITDDGTPGWWDSTLFITTSSLIPANWVAYVTEGGIIEMGPEPWLRRGFWEAYFDQDRDARLIFDEELQKILAE